LIGHGDRFSVRPGETIAFKVGSQGPAPFEASLVRIVCAEETVAIATVIDDGNPQTDKLRYLHRDHIIANMRDRFLDAEVRFELPGRA
jgi:hypothetical protein